MAAGPFGLYELLAPQFLLGFRFPANVDRYLSVAHVERLRMTAGAFATVYTGEIVFGLVDDQVQTQHQLPTGGVLRWDDMTVPFRLTIPRDGAAIIGDAVGAIAATDTSFQSLFERFGAVELTTGPTLATDYPGLRFRLELLLSTLTFHLGDEWRGGVVDASTHRVIPDASLTGEDARVKIRLPKIALVYEQGDDLSVDFKIASWGSEGLDAPADIAMGELVRMEPPIALHTNGRVAFGLDQVLLDLSKDNTPSAVLSKFGVDESFQGIYLKSIRLYWVDEARSWGFQVAIQDCLIDFNGKPSFEASLDIFGSSAPAVRVRFWDGARERSGVSPGGEVSLPTTGEIHVEVTGGTPPYTTSVTVDGTEIWVAADRCARLSSISPGSHALAVNVSQATGALPTQSFTLRVAAPSATRPRDGAPADHPPEPARPPTFTPELSTAPAGTSITLTGDTGTSITLRVEPPDADVTVNGSPVTPDAGAFSVDVADGGSATLSVHWGPVAGAPRTRTLHSHVADPDDAAAVQRYADAAASGGSSVSDTAYNADSPRTFAADVGAATPSGGSKHVTLHGFCSRTGNNAGYEVALSQRRIDVARRILEAAGGFTIDSESPNGDYLATGNAIASDQRVEARFTTGGRDDLGTFTSTVTRPARPQQPDQPEPTPAEPSRAPDPEPNRPPPVFRRISFRTRWERGEFVLGEVTGSLDFETELESSLRQGIADNGGPDTSGPHLDAQAGGAGADDGVVDFGLTVTWDTATFTLSESLRLHSGLQDSDGLAHIDGHANPPGDGGSTDLGLRFKDTFGALAVFAPVINQLAAGIDPDDAGSWVAAGVSFALPAAMGAVGLVQLKRFVLYGGELRARQVIPPSDPFKFADVALLLDYGVEFFINIRISDSFKIRSTRPLKIRYKAVGFNIQFDPPAYHPVFDTSQGYEIDLRDPGLFSLPDPLGKIIAILGARISRVNPVMLEAELGLKANLGIITVDRFYLRWQVEPMGFPLIVPTGVRVDIPGALKGAGFVRILEDGFEGGIDLTIVPIKIRVTADVGVRNVKQGDREATAFYLGLSVEFPTPILLGPTGLGIYGFVGLFATHYRRTELLRLAGSAVPPALAWLKRAKGQPQRFQVDGDTLWEPKLDAWAFGIGIILGTAEGGFLVNLRGAFVLELPGPRVLILVKVQIIQPLPSMGDGSLDVGILGVIDIGPDAVLVGVLIDLNIVDLIRIQIPVELFFDTHDKDNWHLWIGTLTAPASADVLGIVRARAYFMIDGKKIPNFPTPSGPKDLPGLAVAAGFSASLVLGDEGIGLYLKVAAGFDVGISFAPWYIAGRAFIEGELRLFIISIGADGHIDIEMGDGTPLYAHCRICGHVDFFFFSIGGCVEFDIGSPPTPPPAPALFLGMWLQSHAPVLTSGQGGERPIDASLGNALPLITAGAVDFPRVDVGGTSTSVGAGVFADTGRKDDAGMFDGWSLVDAAGTFHRVTQHTVVSGGMQLALATTATPAAGSYALVRAIPVDSHPVLQLLGSPVVSGASTFTEPLVTAPGLFGAGWMPIGGDRSARYTLTSLQLLDGTTPTTFSPAPPATWRRPHPPGAGGQDTALDLALFSRVPVTGERALEQSTELDATIHLRWDDACTPVAPPACVLWTFCHQAIGPSGVGWDLDGVAQPDPAGTRRDVPVDTEMEVEEPTLPAYAQLFQALYGPSGAPQFVPAEVLGRLIPTKPHFGTAAGRLAGLLARRECLVRSAAELVPVEAAGLAAIGIAQPAVRINPPCIRLLQLPWIADGDPQKGGHPPELDEEGRKLAQRAVEEAQASLWVILRTDEFTSAQFYVAAPPAWIKTGRVVLDWMRGDAVLLTLPIRDLVSAEISGLNTGLPAAWLAPPWRSQLDTVARYLATTEFGSLQRVLLSVKPVGDADRLRLRILPASTDGLLERMDRLLEASRRELAERAASEKEVAKFLATERVVRPATIAETRVSRAVLGLRPVALTPAALPVAAQPVAVASQPFFKDRITRLDQLVSREILDKLLASATTPPRQPRLERVILAAAQVCRKGELERAQTAEAVASGEIATLRGYLSSDANVPLLRPATTYTVKATYATETKEADGTVTPNGTVSQSFRFRTDETPPRRLDAYVLNTTPEMGDNFHFYGDPIRVKFNDTAILQLFGTYGRTVRMVLQAADGAVADTSDVAALGEMAGELAAPYRALLTALVNAGLLPCVGEADLPVHGVWDAPVTLRPLMDYVLDLRDVDPPSTSASVPLFRRRFRTSAYAGIAELGAVVDAARVEHLALGSAFAGLPTVSGGSDAPMEDVALEAALRAAGETRLGPPRDARTVVYWVASGTGWRPEGFLVDAPEPLWRSRSKPELQVVPNQDDPNFKTIVLGAEVALRVTARSALAGSAVVGYVRNTAGTRTLVRFTSGWVPSATGDTIELRLDRPASAQLSLPAESALLLRVRLFAKAPWED